MKKIAALCVLLISILVLSSSGDSKILFGGAYCQASDLKSQIEDLGVFGQTPLETLPVIACKYYDEIGFKASLKDAGLKDDPDISSEEQVYGGILPHHLVAAPMIARFFEVIKKTEVPETVILMGPNHKRTGEVPLHTGAFSWRTPFGLLEADESIVNGLIGSLNAGVNDRLLEEEHSVSSLIPYVYDAFPNAQIVPILIHGNMTRKECKSLANFLSDAALQKPSLILASIDFSHGLSSHEAMEKNKSMQKIIESRDYETLFGLDNTYLDAPPTLAAFLMTMDSLLEALPLKNAMGKEKGPDSIKPAHERMLEEGDASRFLESYVPDTTSYMTWIFYQ